MRTLVALTALALLAPPAAHAGRDDEPVTFKPFRKTAAGDRERIENVQSDVVRTSTPGGGAAPDASSSSEKTDYVVEYLGGEANPYSKQIVSFKKAAHASNGQPANFGLDGKKVVVQQREGKTGFRLADGDDLSDAAQEFLKGEFGGEGGDGSDSGGSLIRAFWPKDAVAAGQSWDCDTDLLAKDALSGFEGLTLDPDKSRGHATLVRVYEKDGVTYARMTIEATVAIVRNESKDEVMKFNPPMAVRFTGSYDACIDGTTANMTANVKWTSSGTATIKNSDGESRLKIEVSGSTFKRCTLLPKE